MREPLGDVPVLFQAAGQWLTRNGPWLGGLSGRRYRLCPQGYSICLVFLKLFERVYSPLTAGLLQPYRADSKLQHNKQTQLDRLYQKIADDLDELLDAVGLKAA
jgi:hypothetical protein